ncbi:MAG: S41 family peptidase [Chlorobiaceae bacterium]
MQQNEHRKERYTRRVKLKRQVSDFLVAWLFFYFVPSPPLYCVSSFNKQYFDIVKSIDLLGEVYRQVSVNYVDSLNVSKLMYAGIDGMLHFLDPYTVFLDKDATEELDELTSGQYAGIGITIAAIDGTIFITSVVDGYAAAKAGIKTGDSITAINSINIDKKSIDEVKELLKGPLGGELSLTIERDGQSTFTVSIIREEIRVNNVSYSGIIGNTGYIKLNSFGIHSLDEMREAFHGIMRQATEKHLTLNGVILDLRNNPGGLLNAAVDVVSLFVRKGSDVVSVSGRLPEATKSYVTLTPPINVSIPLVVLINKQSASAAEIVSGAFQDLDRAVIIGEHSYGKGLVQSVISLSYDNTLKLTTAKYYTPSGRLIQKESGLIRKQRKALSADEPDQISNVFYTKKKRKVYGGGGITPDIELFESNDSPYLMELRKKGMLFLFSSSYSASNSVVAQSLNNQTLMMSFGHFLRDKKFIYLSASEQIMNELKESLSTDPTEKIGVKPKIPDELQKTVKRLKEKEIAKESECVFQALEVEILRRYDKHLAQMKELNQDPAVKKAIEVLSDSRQYSLILHL